ncbi:DsbE family thiol:disulfide interchange protein [Asticcacaulis sp. YBE204]|uniref:DsbE family thiol:disulfide interchange protein n=1 Tax=Asticcacaulis sp. YBE204 TaxID=1282363 RepID=UPI0003C3CB68|nr:DsbE family thiol:disulfide interchange protein [Asticcacaulis sp. YBE204]ESQ78555.1 thiol oxidoreductase DsbE [Asticcacaulis sp. YBE204]
MKRLILAVPLVVLVGVLSVLGWYNFHKKAEYAPAELVGKPVPERALTDLHDGSAVTLKALVAGYNKPVLVNVFASWCTPCQAEHPYLMDLKAKGVVIIGIDHKDTPINGLSFVNTHGDPYAKILSDEDGAMGLDLGISGVPETFIVGPDGVVIDKITGPILPETVDKVYDAVKAGTRLE